MIILLPLSQKSSKNNTFYVERSNKLGFHSNHLDLVHIETAHALRIIQFFQFEKISIQFCKFVNTSFIRILRLFVLFSSSSLHRRSCCCVNEWNQWLNIIVIIYLWTNSPEYTIFSFSFTTICSTVHHFICLSFFLFQITWKTALSVFFCVRRPSVCGIFTWLSIINKRFSKLYIYFQ